ncbi:MAG: yebZ [Panacagrimonas sp.]|nr:CopD family protein [Panacagrimonas sp.]MCC2657182.1 yebZ [Panacagrimonas sp.]
MIEAYAAGARALAALCGAYLIGTPLFLLRAGASDDPAVRAWRARLLRFFPIAALGLLFALLGLLHAQASGVAAAVADLALTRDIASSTAFGRIALVRLGLALLLVPLAIGCAVRAGDRISIAAVAAMLLAAVVVGAGPLSGHAAGTDVATVLVTLHVVHVLALACWIGGLPAWITLARAAQHDHDGSIRAFAAVAMTRFSRFALPCMAVIVVAGSLIALEFVDDQGDLLGTRYGRLLCLKILALLAVLAIAHRLRTRWLPRLDEPADLDVHADGVRRTQREALFAVVVLALGAGLAQTTPAIHDQPHWWLPWRLSFDASAEVPGSRIAVLVGAGLLIAAAWWAALGARSGRGARRGIGVLGLAGLGTAAWGLSVPAYPDTFLRSPVPYLTLSIDQGRRAFAQNCVACHGTGGLGDGVLASTLRRPPADMSAPHTALHTAGDMYWWITHGMPEGPMPGFGSVLDDEQRWDTVNFLRVFSQGFQARVLSPRIVPRGPWLGAPDFYYATADGGRAQLKDLRAVRAALIVFTVAGDPRSLARLGALRSRADPRLAIVEPTSPDVWQAYQFLTRTLADRGAPDRLDLPRRHAEFLVDRFGYVRARWLPEDDPTHANDFDLDAAVSALAEEPEILPPPDLHLH